MSYTVEAGVRCRRCGHTSESMDAAVDHAVDEHDLASEVVERALVDGQCRYCDAAPDTRDAAVDHLESAHSLVTNAVCDAVVRVTPGEVRHG